MAGRYVHMFHSKLHFQGVIMGILAYLHEDGTYTGALRVCIDKRQNAVHQVEDLM
jgi:hypothetical protein